jgi:hypothetical protein
MSRETTGVEREAHRLRDLRGECPEHPPKKAVLAPEAEALRMEKVRARYLSPPESRLPHHVKRMLRSR